MRCERRRTHDRALSQRRHSVLLPSPSAPESAMNQAHLVALLAVITALGCGPPESAVPEKDAGTSSSDAGDAGHPGRSCDGTCTPSPPGEWAGPALLWTGDEAKAPLCLDVPGAPAEMYTGHANPSGPPMCSECTCGPPTGGCSLSETLTAAAASCMNDGPGVAHTSLLAPNGSGTCFSVNATPAGLSVTVAPLTEQWENGCLPIQALPSSRRQLGKHSRVHALVRHIRNPARRLVKCVWRPSLGRSSSSAFFQTGEPNSSHLECPSTYPNRSVFYQGPLLSAPCACGLPESTCTGSISLFSDGACSVPLLPALSTNSKDPTCADVKPGSTVRSVSASKPIYKGGSCPQIGGQPLNGTVFCCQP